MAFIDEIKQRARTDIKTIVLPEAEDIRTLEATRTCPKRKICQYCISRKYRKNKKKSRRK